VRPFAALDRLAGRLTPYAGAILRVGVGWVFLRHGVAKVGMGAAAVAGFFHGLGIPFPHVFAVVVIVTETVGAACVVAGFLTRFWAACMAVDMVVAILVAVLPRPFELEGLLLAGSLALIGLGDGPLSVGRLIAGKPRA